jgi:beta-carotene hydroxylase
MSTQTVRRPLLPSEWYQPSPMGTLGFIIYAVALCTVPGVLCRVVATSFDSLPLRIVIMLPLTVLTAYGFQLLGFVGHEGLHVSLHRNKIVSVLLGLFFASSVVTYFEMGFAVHHWNHHRFTNQASDPDIQPVEHLKSWWQRVLFSRPIYNFLYFKTALNIALGNNWPFVYKMPFELKTARLLCWVNFAFALFWLAVYTAITFYDPLIGLFSIAIPLVVTMLINACQIYIDHAGTSDEMFRNAWSRTSPLMTILYFGSNYHLEHHLYPGVPCYRLYKVHKLLKEQGIYEKVHAPVESSFFGSYRNVAADYTAGTDSMFDPFQPATEESVVIS